MCAFVSPAAKAPLIAKPCPFACDCLPAETDPSVKDRSSPFCDIPCVLKGGDVQAKIPQRQRVGCQPIICRARSTLQRHGCAMWGLPAASGFPAQSLPARRFGWWRKLPLDLSGRATKIEGFVGWELGMKASLIGAYLLAL